MQEQQKIYSYTYPRPSVTADVVCISKTDELRILLVKRGREPFRGYWALPGGFVEIDEDLEEAAKRELKEETGLETEALTQFRCFGAPGRDPRGRTISIVHIAYYNGDDFRKKVNAGDDAAEAKWFDLKNLPPLAFDHDKIVEEALKEIL